MNERRQTSPFGQAARKKQKHKIQKEPRARAPLNARDVSQVAFEWKQPCFERTENEAKQRGKETGKTGEVGLENEKQKQWMPKGAKLKAKMGVKTSARVRAGAMVRVRRVCEAKVMAMKKLLSQMLGARAMEMHWLTHRTHEKKTCLG